MKLLILALAVATAAACTCTTTCTAPGTECDEIVTKWNKEQESHDGDACKASGESASKLCKAYGGTGCEASCPCFPADAVVTLDNGSKKKMGDLAVGDKVLTHNGVFSEAQCKTADHR